MTMSTTNVGIDSNPIGHLSLRVFVYTSLRLRERHLSYQRHLDLMVGGARITPAPVESIEDRVDGNASDTDREDCSPASDSDDE
jgi:hypothetical protein